MNECNSWGANSCVPVLGVAEQAVQAEHVPGGSYVITSRDDEYPPPFFSDSHHGLPIVQFPAQDSLGRYCSLLPVHNGLQQPVMLCVASVVSQTSEAGNSIHPRPAEKLEETDKGNIDRGCELWIWRVGDANQIIYSYRDTVETSE